MCCDFVCNKFIMFSIGTFVFLTLLVASYAQDSDYALNYIHKLTAPKIIIDTDAGSDDAVALLAAIQYHIKEGTPEIVAITCVNGNTALKNVKVNVLKTLTIADQLQIPVYAGAHQSILHTPQSDNFFGDDGFGDFDFPKPNMSLIQREHAVNALIRLVRENPGQITICAIGPLTNIALATRLDPTFRKNVKQIMILGGSVNGYGNMPPNVEFNMYMDPEANFIVFNSTDSNEISPLVIVPWDTIILDAAINMSWRQNIFGKIPSDLVDFLNKAEMVYTSGRTFWSPSDSLLVALTLEPDIVTNATFYHIDAAVQGEYRGGLIVDRRDVMKKYKNTMIVTDVNVEMYKEFLMKYFS